MSKQLSLSFLHDEWKEVKTHKREFLEKMGATMLWDALSALISGWSKSNRTLFHSNTL